MKWSLTPAAPNGGSRINPQPIGYYYKPTPTHTGEVQSVCASSWMIPGYRKCCYPGLGLQ